MRLAAFLQIALMIFFRAIKSRRRLNLGDDGHTASLFPETDALEETTRCIVANFVPKLDSWRLTFTFPLINQARQICFLVNASKGKLIDRVLNGDPHYPASRVNPAVGDVTWIVDLVAN